MAEVVFNGVSDNANLQGTLFQDTKFWISQKVPSRSRFIADIKANGGQIVPLENQADVKIMDHARKEVQPGSYSYTYIDKSISNGALEDLENHAIGPPLGTVRSVGSVVQPAKGSRTKFSEEDDRVLWLWVTQHPQKGGGTFGNEIYKQLEAKNPRHPWQSWRDRWVKYLTDTPRPAFVPNDALPSPPLDQSATISEYQRTRENPDQEAKKSRPFSAEDAKALLDVGEDILAIDQEKTKEAWAKWVQIHDPHGHTAQEWEDFWEQSICPVFLKGRAKSAKNNEKCEATTNAEVVSTQGKLELVAPAISSPPKEALPVRRIHRSPSRRAESPRISTRSPSPRKRTRPWISEDTSKEDEFSSDLPSHTRLLASNLASVQEIRKRKRDSSEEELFLSPQSEPSNPTKLQRRHDKQDHLIEIPSTPEKSPVRGSRSPLKRKEPAVMLAPEEIYGHEEGEDEDGGYSDSESHLGRQPSQSLSEPDGDRRINTQAVFNNPTQLIDFGVPPPEEGWSSNEEEPLPSSSPPRQQPLPKNPDTQALLTSETQVPDLSLPDPDGGWEAHLPSSPPEMPPIATATSSSPLDLPASDATSALDAWIDVRIAAGFPPEAVELALKCTSMDDELAEETLKFMMGGSDGEDDDGAYARGGSGWRIPNARGVWIEGDDADLDATDARRIGRLEAKHGAEGVRLRWEFLRLWRERED